MTTLGKILVFVNLLLSLFIMALIVSTYVGRTNWQRAYDDVLKDRDIAKADAQTAVGLAAQRQATIDQQEKNLAACKAEVALAKQEAELQVKREKDQTQLAQQQIAQLNTNLTTVKQELQASQNERNYLRDRTAALDKEIQMAHLQVQEAQNAQVEAEINFRKTLERNERLLAENERMHKENQTLKHAALNVSVTGNGPKQRPPAEDVEGVVKATDNQSGYVTITVGSDAGLKNGDTLEVYRLKPEPAYLGIVEIVRVRNAEAVARPLTKMRGGIQVGDRVSSNVVTKR